MPDEDWSSGPLRKCDGSLCRAAPKGSSLRFDVVSRRERAKHREVRAASYTVATSTRRSTTLRESVHSRSIVGTPRRMPSTSSTMWWRSSHFGYEPPAPIAGMSSRRYSIGMLPTWPWKRIGKISNVFCTTDTRQYDNQAGDGGLLPRVTRQQDLDSKGL